MGLPPATRIQDDQETLTRGRRSGTRPLRRTAAFAALLLAVAAAGLYGQGLSSGPRATGSTSSPTGSSSPVAVATALSASPASLAPGGIVPVPVPTVAPVTPEPMPTGDMGWSPQVHPPLDTVKTTPIKDWNGGAGSRSGSRFYVPTDFGIDVIDMSTGLTGQLGYVSGLTGPVSCTSGPANMAAAGNLVLYSLDAPGAGTECGGQTPGWHFELANAASGSVREVKAVMGTVANLPLDPPLVAISSDVYAFAYEETTSKTIVEVHTLATDKLLWSAALTGQLQSLTAGGSRILLSLYSHAPATAGDYPAMTQLFWMDRSHHDPQPLAEAWGAGSLSLDGSTAAWFGADSPGCHSLYVKNLDTGDGSLNPALRDGTQARSCQVAVDAVQGHTTVAWTPTDNLGPQFLAISYGNGFAYEFVGLPRLSWISLQGRTLSAISDSGPQAISIDLDVAYPVLI